MVPIKHDHNLLCPNQIITIAAEDQITVMSVNFSVFAKMFSSKISNISSASKQSLEMCNKYVREKKKISLSQTLLELWNQAVHELFLSQSLILNY